MAETAGHWLCSVEIAQPGFTVAACTKRNLLNGAVILLARDLTEIESALPDYRVSFVGIIVTPGEPCSVEPLSPLAWRAVLPLPLNESARTMLRGWLQSIEQASQARQSEVTARIQHQRLERAIASTQADYNDVTSRLRCQVDELQQSKMALFENNSELENRVTQRTTALAQANTDLSSVVRELQQTQSELVHKEKMAGLGSMVAGVAHELNTPIGNALTVASAMCYEARTLRRSVQAGALKRSALERYTTETEEMSDAVEKNLAIAANIIGHFKQLSVDQTSENRRQFLLSNVISDTLSALGPRLRKSTHQLELDLDNSLRLDSFPGAIGQVLANLIINALIHAFNGREAGRMTLRSHLIEDGNSVEIVFTDDGAGISEAHQKRVFDPFFTTRLGQGGSGLGMHLVYNLVTSMLGGKIKLNSHLGRGTQIQLTIPIAAPTLAARVAGP